MLDRLQRFFSSHRFVSASPPASAEGKDTRSAPEASGSAATSVCGGPMQDPPFVLVIGAADLAARVRQALVPAYRVENVHAVPASAASLDPCPDLVIADLRDTAREAIVAQLRSRSELAALPLLVVIGGPDDHGRMPPLGEGPGDYLRSPFTAMELQVRARNLVAIARAAEAPSADGEGARRTGTNFLALVSHELRSPLAVLLLQLERLEIGQDSLSETARALVARMARSARRLDELIQGLQQYARLRSRAGVAIEDVDLAALARDVVAEMSTRLGETPVELRPPEARSMPPLKSDPSLVRLVLCSLAEEAAKSAKRNPITIEVNHSSAGHRCVIGGYGPLEPPSSSAAHAEGRESAEAQREPFALALARDVVSALGGSITVEGRDGEEQRFTLLWRPRFQQAAETAPGGALRL